ncbi:UDP-N-acetylglucosamine--N-acetylmuramyl-(pentapeptide) pyrophosphoryl-undecaprenol N-acetylglucosamine transferase [bacterium]|jgi:UDP-N-acetylglucosamine--N-acetylmuramyl-(pentapeptide) pyrophosphoryl-undecaprenol N-acetylglucosamine transferase|nr:UDP-N-acetylglucosamine--N-acetylmuramyl-(pentapeptide) pyrophosphoryl-undecaprenol N-acetylglucosamine transferase [bacterium]MBT6293943.1 UDP-N-acetylglucosamine--N-acetylmuramyl-(pentapeptide) pyrophosphoryl-undecaprenol N-acetylglucosamine transferase [bacterium]
MKIALVGGGTAGHIIPSISVIEKIQEIDPKTEFFFVAADQELDKKNLESFKVKYFLPIAKLRRYFDIKNFTDIFVLLNSVYKSIKILKKEQPDLIFSKGGFIAVPFCIAAKILRIPIIMHESDSSIGLANKIIMPLAKQVWLSHPSSINKRYLSKTYVLNLPILNSLISPRSNFKHSEYINPEKRNILILGGSLGAEYLNDVIYEHREELKHHFNVIHVIGMKNFSEKYQKENSYIPLDYIKDLGPVYEITDLCLSRAGAGTLAELDSLRIPAVLVPLTKAGSRGDQLLNAEYFIEKNANSNILLESYLDSKSLLDHLLKLPNRSSKHSPKNQDKVSEKIYALFKEASSKAK